MLSGLVLIAGMRDGVPDFRFVPQAVIDLSIATQEKPITPCPRASSSTASSGLPWSSRSSGAQLAMEKLGSS
jgi:hypothetical protein